MAKPPASPPSSDVTGVNRDGRVNTPAREPHIRDAEQIEQANEQARGRPPSDSGTGATGK